MNDAVSVPASRAKPSTGKDWWRGAVIYQIYPRSFQDSDGDGVGDLRRHHAPACPTSPTSASTPSGFRPSSSRRCAISATTLPTTPTSTRSSARWKISIAWSPRRTASGLKVIIDQVLSHTSDEHPWFKESRASRTIRAPTGTSGPIRSPDGTPPNNWLSIFGGSAWNWDTRRCQYYFHNFLAEQPDLNFHNPRCPGRAARYGRVLAEARRRRLPPRYRQLLFPRAVAAVEPAGAHPRCARGPGGQPLQLPGPSLRQEPAGEPRISAAGCARCSIATAPPPASARSATGSTRCTPWPPTRPAATSCTCATRSISCRRSSRRCISASAPRRSRRSPATAGRAGRSPTTTSCATSAAGRRGAICEKLARLAAGILLSLRGSVSLYEGEELGLTEAALRFEDLADPYGIRFWPEFKGRDGCRTPMVWESNAPNGGFSTAAKTWLPVPAEHAAHAANRQAGDGQFDARALPPDDRLPPRPSRRSAPAPSASSTRQDDVLAFERSGESERIACLFNLGHGEAVVELPAEMSLTAARGARLFRRARGRWPGRPAPAGGCVFRRGGIGGEGPRNRKSAKPAGRGNLFPASRSD